MMFIDSLVGDCGKDQVKGSIFQALYEEYEKYLRDEDGTMDFWEWKRAFSIIA